MQHWFIDSGEGVTGPYSAAEMARRLQQGKLGAGNRVSPDQITWLPAEAVSGLLASDQSVSATVEAKLEPPAPSFPGFEVQGVIGRGGMGTVYKARQLKLGRSVALKTVPFTGTEKATKARRFSKEAEVLARLQHPNIVQVFDFHCDDNVGHFAMELLDGEDLDTRISRAGPMDERTAWLVARQAASALAYAASQGIIHRDVKPGNLYLVPAPGGLGLPAGVPLVKVMDFGLATTALMDERITADGTILGTPAYMAPEQTRDAQVDHRADIYALGATMYHALSGEPPFAGRGIWDLIAEKNRASPRLPPPVSDESASLVTEMMDVDPARRIQTHEELLGRIDGLSFLRGACPPPPRKRRPVWPWVLAVLIPVAGVVGWRLWPRAAPAVVSFVSVGPAEQMFDGKSLLLWSPAGGQPWVIEPDEDGARVLAGKGVVRRRFRPYGPEFRVTLGIDLHQATAVEVALESDGASAIVMRIDRQKGAVVGQGEGVPYPSAEMLADKAPYQEVQLVRAGGQWIAYFRGERVGAVPAGQTPREVALRVNAEGGSVRIDSAQHDEVRVE